MNFLKRAFYSLRHRWWQNLLLVLLFAALFAVAAGSLTLYGTTNAQSAHLQKALGSAVSIRGITYTLRDNSSVRFAAAGDGVPPEAGQVFASAPQVESYNFTEHCALAFKDAEPLYKEEFKKFKEYSFYPMYTVSGVVLADSSLHQLFTVYGFQLTQGEHLAPDMAGDYAALISQPFAQLNGLHPGDSFEVYSPAEPKDNRPLVSLRVQGIFEPPESAYEKRGLGDSPEEMVFLTPRAGYDLRTHTEEKDIRFGWRDSARTTVYLRSPEDVDAFVAQMKEKLPIRQVVESLYQQPTEEPVPEAVMGMSDEEMFAYFEEHEAYDLYLDREWYQMVGAPLEKARDLAGAIAAFLLTAILLVLVLTMVLMLSRRRREMGVLLSMGESKGKVALQLAAEAFVPLGLAMALGLPLGLGVGTPVVENLCNGVYQQSADLRQAENDQVKHAAAAQDQYATQVSMPSYSSTYLVDSTGERVMVYPKAAAHLDAWSLAAYLLVTAAALLLAVAIQAGAVFRLRPARILTGKGV